MKSIFNAMFFFLLSAQIVAQDGGGSYHFEKQECISPTLRSQMLKECQAAYQKLKESGKLEVESRKKEKFIWPIRNSITYPEQYVYSVFYFVDHNALFSANDNLNTVKDYDCGTRTYDTGNYNHTGTDISLWPFHWDMMEKGHAEVISARSGTILLKKDGSFDKNCAFCTNCDWNALYILHDDNTISIYGHLKKGSLTSKKEMDAIAQGDFIGLVGSSGNSTGPHLHFEVNDINGSVIDPFAGSCNDTAIESLWESQIPYFDPGINRLMTATKGPKFGACIADGEASYESRTFKPGDKVIYAAYYHDQVINSESIFRITFPDGSDYQYFSFLSPETYFGSYWYWEFVLPVDAPAGTYTFSCIYAGKEIKTTFDVENTTSVKEQSLVKKEVYFQNKKLITTTKDKSYQVEIYNMLGQQVMQVELVNELSLAQLPMGSYYIHLIANSENQVKPAMKITIVD